MKIFIALLLMCSQAAAQEFVPFTIDKARAQEIEQLLDREVPGYYARKVIEILSRYENQARAALSKPKEDPNAEHKPEASPNNGGSSP